MLVSLTVGKVDAGVTVLLTQDKRLVRGLELSRLKWTHASPMRFPTLSSSPPPFPSPPAVSNCV